MFRMNRFPLRICIVLLCTSGATAYAQNSISVSSIEPHAIELAPQYGNSNPKEATAEYLQWLNYTTLTDSDDPAFSITVQLRQSNLPWRMNLKIKADPYQGFSKGTEGSSAGVIAVLQGARTLVDDITTCYSGAGRGQGHCITFFFSIPDYTKVSNAGQSVDIVYTLTQ